MPPSMPARSPSTAPGPYSAIRSPPFSTRMTPSSTRKTSVPGSPSCTRVSPAESFRNLGFELLSIIWTDSARSRAVSTAVTRAGESWSPQGVCFPKDLRYQSLKSVSPDLAANFPSSS